MRNYIDIDDNENTYTLSSRLKKDILEDIINFMRYLKVLTVSLLLFPYSLYSLVDPNYEIDKIYNEKIFYNVFSLNNEVYVSSNDGIYNIKSGNVLEMYDSNVKGPIDNSFAKTKLEIRRLESPIILNSTYNNSTTDFLYFKVFVYNF